MYERRMDLAQLAQSAGLWQWQVRRHLRPDVFARLSPRELARYADALGITAESLVRLPRRGVKRLARAQNGLSDRSDSRRPTRVCRHNDPPP